VKHEIQLRIEREKARAEARRFQVVKLIARRLRKSPDELLDSIPAETIKRLGVPVITIEHEDGSLTFKDIIVVPGTMRVSSPGRGSTLVQPGSNEDLRGGAEH
jgi:hypothetical protein